jgi:protocatechuate 3,4-dioxygenase beta subunit
MRRSCVLLFLLGLAMPAFGQSNYAVLTGTVTDPQHLPVAGAAVELTAASTGAVRRRDQPARTLRGPGALAG